MGASLSTHGVLMPVEYLIALTIAMLAFGMYAQVI
jgi:hypothetical protein